MKIIQLLSVFACIIGLVLSSPTQSLACNSTASNPTRLLKVSIYARRNPNITEDEFHSHWSNIHGPLCTPWLVKYGILRYTQYHTTEADRAAVLGAGANVTIDYDGIGEFWVTSLEAFGEAITDPYYTDIIARDEAYLFDKGGMAITSGYVQVFVEDGKTFNPGVIETSSTFI